VIAQAFVAGGATLVVALVLFQLWVKTPPRSVCPCCGEPTAAVTHPLLALAARWVRLRWCVACGWRGWGRNGPVLSRSRGPVSDGSGFRWGPERLAMDFGFRWAERPMATGGIENGTSASVPAHPSGFRWASATDATDTLSAFRFRAPTEDDGAPAAHPSGFRWAEAPSERPVALAAATGRRRWSSRARAPGAQSFRWKS
jgi:hypothetical protein